MTENEKDIELLRSDPQALVLKYQEMLKIIVKKNINIGMFNASEFEDVVQEINIALLKKIPAMQVQYNGMALFKTYLSVIVRNICLKLHSKETRGSEVEIKEPGSIFDRDSIEERSMIEDEIERFETILNLYHRNRPKLLFCLKLYFRIPIARNDILLWYPRCGLSDQATLMKHFGKKFDDMGDVEVYTIVTPILNRNENKSNSVDALRKWTDSKVHEIIDVLNGTPKEANYTPDALKVLVDDFFSPFLLRK